MAKGGAEAMPSPTDDAEYNEKLFKEVLTTFRDHMPPMELRDCPIISHKLSNEEMEKIGRKHHIEGNCAAARLLLELLMRKKDWFPTLLKALESDELKLKDFIPRFKVLKRKVDQEWCQAHFMASMVTVNNPSGLSDTRPPTQCMETDRTTPTARPPVPVSGQNIIDDFKLPLLPTATLQRDTALESMEEEPSEPVPSASGAQSQELEVMDEAMSPQADQACGGEEQYTDASSTPLDDKFETYQRLQPKEGDENEYTVLANVCLEKDATPVPVQPSEVPEQEVGVEPQPQVLNPQQVSQRRRPRPQTREEHPSLRQAISRDPQRDFEEAFVKDQLAAMSGWSRHQEEHKVIQLIRPNRNTPGYYVIWYWKLAKRPTICVAQGGRVITFVVHKSARSATRPTVRYYINKRQKVSDSIRQLVEFHVAHGIQYCPQQGAETTIVWLSHAYVSR